MTRLRARHQQCVRPAAVAEGSVLSVFRVPKEVEGMRLDVFLVGQFRRTSRTRAQRIIENSAYDVHGKPLRPNDRVHAEMKICLWRAPWDEVEVPTDVPILWEDEFFLAVDKPSGLPVHPTARYYQNTLTKLLERARPDEHLTLVHRIDRETSGVLLVAKDPQSDRGMKKMFEERDGVDKMYRAITWGVPRFPSTLHSAGCSPDEASDARAFRYERSVELDPEHHTGVKMRLGASDNALHAATRFTIEEVTKDNGYARIVCDLETGRQHQIRLHLQALGAPIVGDKLYGPDDALFARGADGELTAADLERLELPRHALHAARLSFNHPRTGARIVVESDLPDDLRAFWSTVSDE